MSIDKEAAEQDFDDFLMIMEDQLDYLKEEAERRGIFLDSSPDDLDKLEQLFDLMSETTDKKDIPGLVVLFARHLGEIVRLNYGGKWELPLDDEKNVNFNTPVLTGHCPVEGVECAPISIMHAYSLRRKKGTLKRAVDADVNPTSIDLSDLVEEK
jgi:hypothetical protein